MPGWMLSIAAISVGVALHYPYALVAKKRWGLSWSNPVNAILLTVVPDQSWPAVDRNILALLKILKFAGVLLILTGAAMLIGGISDPPLLQ